MSDSTRHTDTRERLLDAAEYLFAQRGVDATSLRHITVEAAANLASVNYHFGSKEALFRAVFVRRIGARQLGAPGPAQRLRAGCWPEGSRAGVRPRGFCCPGTALAARSGAWRRVFHVPDGAPLHQTARAQDVIFE